MPAAPATANAPVCTDRARSWTVTVRPNDIEPWVVTLTGPIDRDSAALLTEMAEWVGGQKSVDRLVLDLWAADVQPDAGGIAALAGPTLALAGRGGRVHIRGAEPCWQTQLALLIPLDSCCFE